MAQKIILPYLRNVSRAIISRSLIEYFFMYSQIYIDSLWRVDRCNRADVVICVVKGGD